MGIAIKPILVVITTVAAVVGILAISDGNLSSSDLSAQGGYPPPLLPTPTAIATAAQGGLVPVPEAITSTHSIAINESPWSAELVQLRGALESGNAASIAAYFPDSGISVEGPDGIGYVSSRSGVESILASLYQSGSDPVIQGYFEYGCIHVLTTGWMGSAQIPNATVVPEFLGAPVMWEVSGPAFVWQVCGDDGVPSAPVVISWITGDDYANILTSIYRELVMLYIDDTALEVWPTFQQIVSW